MVPQLVEDLVHAERSRDRLNEHGGPHDAVGQSEPLLGKGEDVVPEPRLEVVLELGQVVEGAGALFMEVLGVVEEVQPEVDESGDGRAAVDLDVLLRQVPAPGPDDDGGEGDVVAQSVLLALREVNCRVPRADS